jgi:hypothetical protein
MAQYDPTIDNGPIQRVAGPDGSPISGTASQATATVTTVSVATTSTQIAAANTNRKGIILSNVGANNIYINFAGNTAVTTNFVLTPNAGIIIDRWIPTNAITAIAVTGATNLSVTEMS